MAPSDDVYEGVFAIHKPTGMSSNGVLDHVKRQFNSSKLFAPWIERENGRTAGNNRYNRKGRGKNKPAKVKMGHGGTLDPEATGVLIIGIGRGTKCLERFLSCTKSYDAAVLFGAATDTYDREGKVIERANFDHVTKELVQEKLGKFQGTIMQVPPIYSALNVNGKRMYEYAREGGDIPKLQPRETSVKSLTLTEWLEGGSHEYRYPDKEAPAEEKQAAKRILESNDKPEEFPSSKKQKTIEDNALVATKPLEPDVSVVEEPKMSGALQSESATSTPPPKDASTTAVASTSEPSGASAPKHEEAPSSEPELKPSPLDGSLAPACRLTMTVSSGFYVRSLCYDLGKAVDSAAFMASLVRTRQGDFELGKNVLSFEDLQKGEDAWGPQVRDMLHAWMKQEEWVDKDDTLD